MSEHILNEDFRDLLEAFCEEDVEFLVVGAYAVAAHGAPRATGDLDVLVRPADENAARVYRALMRFGAPVQALGIVEKDFARAGMVCQIGLPPRRIDLLTEISGVTFEEAWSDHVTREVDGIRLRFPSKAVLIRNSRRPNEGPRRHRAHGGVRTPTLRAERVLSGRRGPESVTQA